MKLSEKINDYFSYARTVDELKGMRLSVLSTIEDEYQYVLEILKTV